MEAIYICQTEEGELFVNNKAGIDSEIKDAETNDEDLNFKVIGKIKPQHANVDFHSSWIEWFEKGDKEKAFVDKAVLLIIQFLNTAR